MKKRVGVITGDANLYNKIRLLLRNEASVTLLNEGSDVELYDLVFKDLRSDVTLNTTCVEIGEGGDISLPFLHEEIIDALAGASDKDTSALTLSGDGKHVYLFGEAIKLTDVEYRLLERLLDEDGFVSREELLSSVWGDGFDGGVVNVYVCYLRRKLEKSGNKVIIASRGEGYKIDEKYRRKN